jgi:DNA-binding NtrC family response regulator
MCRVLKNLLSERDYDIQSVQTGEAAHKLLADTRFTFAPLDAKITRVEEVQLAAQIKSPDPSINFIVISGYNYEDDVKVQGAIEENLEFGCRAKPFFHEDVIRILDAVVSTHNPH